MAGTVTADGPGPLTDGKLVEQPVEVYTVTGAAGTIGLAQLVSKHRGDAHHLMVTGLVMAGGVVADKSPVELDQVTPIATPTAGQEVLVVPAASKCRNLRQLMDDAKAGAWSVSACGTSTSDRALASIDTHE